MGRNFRGLFKVLNMIFKFLSGRAASALKLQTYLFYREHADILSTIKNLTEIFTHATPAGELTPSGTKSTKSAELTAKYSQ
jgi:hypothetical protein